MQLTVDLGSSWLVKINREGEFTPSMSESIPRASTKRECEQDAGVLLRYLLKCQAQACEREIARKREDEWRRKEFEWKQKVEEQTRKDELAR